MNFDQALIVILLVSMLVVFALDRFRIEVVALAGLAAALLFGLVPMSAAFSGFANPAVVTVIEILLIVQVLGRANLLDRVAGRIASGVGSERGVLLILCALTGALSVFMNNIGALALMLPIVLSTCRMAGIEPRTVLMPVSFAALLGGLCSLIGTPANLIVSQALQAETGRGFAFFDFAYAGVPVAVVSILALVAWAPLVFGSGRKAETDGQGPASGRVIAEALVPAESRIAGAAIAEVPALISGVLHAVIRDDKHLFVKRTSTELMAGDTLLIELDLGAFERAIAAGDLALPSQTRLEQADRAEAVIMPESTLVGSRVATLEPFHSRDIRVVAVASQSHRIEGRLTDLQLGIGDILFLAGEKDAIAEALEEAGLMLLSPSRRLETTAPAYFPLAVFAGGIGLAAFGVPPEIAFGLVVLVLAATRRLNLRTGLAELNWPILIMLAAMIPLGLAMDTTGAAQVMAETLLATVPLHEPVPLIAMVLVLALVITPFANNASTAVVLAPIAIEIARSASLPPEPFLIALALGISIDFLTPFGHHNNTIVMSVGNYRFTDFPKAGFPITVVAVLVAIAAVMGAWL